MKSKKYTNSEKLEYEKLEKKCKLCGNKFHKVWSKYVLSEFCSKSCARKYSTILKRKEINEKISQSLKTYFKTNTKPIAKKKRDEYYLNPKKMLYLW